MQTLLLLFDGVLIGTLLGLALAAVLSPEPRRAVMLFIAFGLWLSLVWARLHAPDVALRMLGTALDKAANARTQLVRVLAKHGVNDAVPLPDISTKAQAQQALGMNMQLFTQEKQTFLNTVVPEWEAQARSAGRLDH